MLASVVYNWISQSWKREEGQAMAEYGIILALVAAVCIAAIALLGNDILKALNTITGAL